MVLKSGRDVVGMIVSGALGVIMAVVIVLIMTVRHSSVLSCGNRRNGCSEEVDRGGEVENT